MNVLALVQRRRTRLLLICVAVLSLLMYSYARATDGTGRAASHHRYTGAELVQGIVFLDGPAARAIWSADVLAKFKDEIAKPAPERTQLFAALTRDHAFLATFAAEMQSGSPVQVRRGLTGLSEHLRAAFKETYGAERLAAADRVSKRFATNMRRLTGSPDYSGGRALPDFNDTARTPRAATGSTPLTPSNGDGTGSFIFSTSSFFITTSEFINTFSVLTYDQELATVIVVVLAVIIVLFIALTIVYPPVVVEGRRYSSGLEQFRQEQLIATLARNLAVS